MRNKTIKMIAVLLITSSMQLHAMSYIRWLWTDKADLLTMDLVQAVRDKNYDLADQLIEKGATDPKGEALWYAALHLNEPFSRKLLAHGSDITVLRKHSPTDSAGWTSLGNPLFRAVGNDDVGMVKFLIEDGGVDPRDFDDFLLGMGIHGESTDTLRVLLATIPANERKKIMNARASILSGQWALKQADPALVKDVQRLIAQKYVTKPFIEELVNDQMKRVNYLLTQKPAIGTITSRMLARGNGREDVARLLDPNDAVEQEKIRKMVRNNVKRILFGEPVEQKPSEPKRVKMSELEKKRVSSKQ